MSDASSHDAASKTGLGGLTRAAARDLAPFDITVNCVVPGRIMNDMIGPPETPVTRAALSRIPIGRFGTADEVADLVASLPTRRRRHF